MAKVSIIVPVYNVKEYLAECVDSIRNQTLADIEIILVDDGSSDGSSEMCDAYAKLDSRVQVIHQHNGGSTRARNAGLLASHGEYIGFVDSDDWIEPQMYEQLLWQCTQNHADLAVCAKYCSHKKSEYKEPLGVPEGIYEKNDPEKTIIRNLIYSEKGQSRGISPNLYDKLFQRELLFRYQFSVDERMKYGEDDVCAYSCLLHAERVAMLDRAFYHYRQRSGSVCHSEDTAYFEKITWFYLQLEKEFLKHPDVDILMEQLKRYMLEFVLRGINKHFGFGYGVVVPFYLPPYALMESRGIQNIALYGAGNVGQSYYRALQMWGNVKVSVWVDRQYEDYQKKSLPVSGVSAICCAEYDAVLIALDNEELAKRIQLDLIALGVEENRIIFEIPRKMNWDLRRME